MSEIFVAVLLDKTCQIIML